MRYQSKQKNISYFLYQLKASEDKTKGIDETRIIQVKICDFLWLAPTIFMTDICSNSYGYHFIRLGNYC